MIEVHGLTPKAFANLSPGLERSDNPGTLNKKERLTLKALGMCGTNPFMNNICVAHPRLSLRSNLGLKLANAFGV